MKVNLFHKTLCVLVIFTFASMAVADSIELRNGHRLQGKYIGGTTNVVGFMTGGTIQYFSTSDVLALIFDPSSNIPLGGLQPESMKKNFSPDSSPTKLQRSRSLRTVRPRAKTQEGTQRQIAD
jgi:hypothetical protein